MSTRLKTFEDIWKARVDDNSKANKENRQDEKHQSLAQKQNENKENNNNKTPLLSEKDWEYLEKLGEKFRELEEKNEKEREDQSPLNNRKKKSSNKQQIQSKKDSIQENVHIKPTVQNVNSQKQYPKTLLKEEFENHKRSITEQQEEEEEERYDKDTNSIENQEKDETDESNSFLRKGGDNVYECTFSPNHLRNQAEQQNEKVSQIPKFDLPQTKGAAGQIKLQDRSFEGKNEDNKVQKNRLYEDAAQRQQKQAVIEKLVVEHTKIQTNTSKITPASQKIILKKIEEFLNALINGVSENKQIKFEGVGNVLQQLGIFRCSKFSVDESVSLAQIQEMKGSEINKMKQEMLFHDQIWNLLSFNQQQLGATIDQVETVESQIFFNILLVLLELKLSVQQSEMLLNQIIQPQQTEQCEQLSKNISNLIRKFRTLFQDRTILMESYANWSKRSIINDDSREMSFQPMINSRSRAIDNSVQMILVSKDEDSSLFDKGKRHELLFQQHKSKQEKHQQQIEEQIQKEIQSCTFKPQINKQRQKEQSENQDQEEDARQIGGNNAVTKRYEKLYQLANKKKEEIKEMQEYIEFSRHEKEVELCTFKPQTKECKTIIYLEGDLQKQVKGLNQQLSRMEKARKFKQDKNLFFERQQVALQEKNEKNQKQGKKVVPFSFDTISQNNPSTSADKNTKIIDQQYQQQANNNEHHQKKAKNQENIQASNRQSPPKKGNQLKQSNQIVEKGFSSLGFAENQSKEGKNANTVTQKQSKIPPRNIRQISTPKEIHKDFSQNQINEEKINNYESQPQLTKMERPSSAINKKIQKQSSFERVLIGHINVNITKNKKGRISLYLGDNAKQLADNFARVYGLSSDMTETLVELLQDYIDKYAKKENQ